MCALSLISSIYVFMSMYVCMSVCICSSSSSSSRKEIKKRKTCNNAKVYIVVMYNICMAKLLNVYIHDDNQEKLNTVVNKAALINELLREHFRKLDPKQMTIEQLKQEYEKEKLKQEFENKMRLIENGSK